MGTQPNHDKDSEKGKLFISEYIQERLNFFKENTQQKQDKLKYTPLHWIATGLSTSQITGDEGSIIDFLGQYLNLEDTTTLNKNGDTPLGCLFRRSIYEIDELTKRNIQLGFKALFSQNPKAILKCHEENPAEMALSAVEKMACHSEFLEIFKSELLDFLIQYLPTLTESEGLILIYSFHDNQELIQQLLNSSISVQSQWVRNPIPYSELQSYIKQFWQPEHKLHFDYFFQDFPLLDIWRLFVDGNKQRDQNEKGWAGYEGREPSCIDKMYQAWKYIQQTATETLSISHIKKIHAICADGIVHSTPAGEYRQHDTSFTLSFDNLSVQGYFHFCKSYADLAHLEKHPTKRAFHANTKKKNNELDQAIDKILKSYQDNLRIAKDNPEAILSAIIKLSTSLEILHPFADCNGRIFCNLIINRELVSQGFSPVLLDNPNRFEGLSYDEILYEMIRGMINFQRLRISKQFKDSQTTFELVHDLGKDYPIPELKHLLEEHLFSSPTLQFTKQEEIGPSAQVISFAQETAGRMKLEN